MSSLGAPSALRSLTKEEFVAQYIREAIVAGRLMPGDRLRQQQLAADLGVSPTPVREALRGLITEGWLERASHIGVSVARINQDGVDEIYRLRQLLESDLAGVAARVITAADLDRIREVNERFRRVSQAGDYAAARQANFQFHALIWDVANSPIAAGILNSLWARMPWTNIGAVKNRDKRSVAEHARVVEALASHDPERARDALMEHIKSGRADYHALAGDGS